jgi:hypothetical protein
MALPMIALIMTLMSPIKAIKEMIIEPYRSIQQRDKCEPHQTKMEEAAIRTWGQQEDGQIFLEEVAEVDLGSQIFQV